MTESFKTGLHADVIMHVVSHNNSTYIHPKFQKPQMICDHDVMSHNNSVCMNGHLLLGKKTIQMLTKAAVTANTKHNFALQEILTCQIMMLNVYVGMNC